LPFGVTPTRASRIPPGVFAPSWRVIRTRPSPTASSQIDSRGHDVRQAFMVSP